MLMCCGRGRVGVVLTAEVYVTDNLKPGIAVMGWHIETAVCGSTHLCPGVLEAEEEEDG